MYREAVVKGEFYPADIKDVVRLINTFKQKEPAPVSARAIILPHAGYMYSGKVAVTTVNKVLSKKKVIILGNNHSGAGSDFGLWPEGGWEVPGGTIEVDEELALSILSCGDTIKKDYLAHKGEHSIEVELPILRYFFSEFKFVPVACKVSHIDSYRRAAAQIYDAIKKVKEDILLVASSDMTHYESDAAVRRKDRIAIDSIIEMDEEALIKNAARYNISMCGIAPVAVLLACVRKLGAQKAQVALYETSGDSSGDYDAVVGYAGIIIK